jgi:hypothetical protein
MLILQCDRPVVGPGAFPHAPSTRLGPRLLRRNSSGPVLRAGPDVETRPQSPFRGRTRRGTEIACGCPHRVEFARGRYIARPIRHSVGRKVVLNRKYCPSVTIRTFRLAIIPRLELTCSNSRCAPAAPRCWPDFSLATPCCRSVFQRPSAGLSNPDTADRLAASLGLALCCCMPGADEARYHSAF